MECEVGGTGRVPIGPCRRGGRHVTGTKGLRPGKEVDSSKTGGRFVEFVPESQGWDGGSGRGVSVAGRRHRTHEDGPPERHEGASRHGVRSGPV